MGVLLCLSILIVAGCESATVGTARRYDGGKLEGMKSAYVIIPTSESSGNTHGIEQAIKHALAIHGVSATTGPRDRMPKKLDFYVEYLDRWQLGRLYTLDIHFVRSADGEMLARCGFENPFSAPIHPDPQKMAEGMLDRIYQVK